MKEAFQKVKELIFASDLSVEDKEDLVLMFADADEGQLKGAMELFESKPEWIKKLSVNYKAKQAVAATRDEKVWDKIVEAEEKELENLEE